MTGPARRRNWVRVRQHRRPLLHRLFYGNDGEPITWDVEFLCAFVPKDGRTIFEWILFATSTNRIDALNRAHRFARYNREALTDQDRPPWWS